MRKQSPVWLFGYGSLVSPASVEGTLGRPVELSTGFGRATLSGYRRAWIASMANIHNDPTDKYFVDASRRRFEGTVSSLGIYPAPGEMNGVILRLEEADLDAFDKRERRYSRVDVTESVTSEIPFEGRVMAYLTRADAVRIGEESRQEGKDHRSAGYERLVETAFAALGPKELATYRSTTDDSTAPALELTMVSPV
jgi:cation transport regulator ChaC